MTTRRHLVMARVGTWSVPRRARIAGLAVSAVALPAWQILANGLDPRRWDWLLLSGLVVFAGAYAVARGVPTRLVQSVQRLRARGVLADPLDRQGHLVETLVHLHLLAMARRYRPWGAAIGVLLMIGLWEWAFLNPWRNLAFWAELVLAGVAGAVVAGFVAFGRLAHVVHSLGLTVEPVPGHLDGAAGLRPVGELYLRQASVVAAIVVYAGVWWLIIGQTEAYEHWRDPYVAVMVIALACEVVACFGPLWTFHTIMLRTREHRLLEADQHAREIRSADDEATITRLTQQWRDIEEMPTWPIDAGLRRRLTWNNVAVGVPVLLKGLAAPKWIEDVGDWLTRAFS